MIRLVLACVIPASLAVAAALLVGPSALSVPRGAPMLVASGERMAALHAVDHAGCPPKLLTGAAPKPAEALQPASVRIVRLDDAPGQVSVTELPFDGPAGTNLVLVLDKDGALIAAGERPGPIDVAAADPPCPPGPEAAAEPGII